MKIQRFFLISVLACSLLSVVASAAEQPNQLTPEEIADGWILLFDGETQFGWEAGSEANWKVADGVISVSEGKPGLLCTTTEFADYELHVDFRAAKGTNSGVFLRTPLVPTDPAGDCYELNIAPADNPFPTGSFVKRKKAAAVEHHEAWRTFDVVADGPKFTIRLDGKTVLEYTDEHPLPKGRIGLQLNQGAVEFRNVKLRPLGTKSLFNGKDLAGWKTDHADKSVFAVVEGAINVKNGRGQLESAGEYANFILQLEAICNGKQLNSGIFLRCIPGEIMNGYESQIHNGYKDGDRGQPVDCGTGGIFRRQNARRVVPDDFAWFAKTIVADGPHFAVWVNGYQVTDWTDDRADDPNPRKGKRLTAGTLMIQGHDPTTDLSFRNLRLAELPERK